TVLPEIPAGVAPLLRELYPDQLLPPGDPLLAVQDQGAPDTGTAATDAMLAGTPLLLLAPQELKQRPGIHVPSGFEFRIGCPTTDLLTWDRWTAGRELDERGKNHRQFIWRSLHQKIREAAGRSLQRPRELDQDAAYLDDPAVAGVWVELVRFSEDGEPIPEGETCTTRKLLPLRKKGTASASLKEPIKSDFSNWRSADPDLATEQHEPVKVKCRVDEDGTLTVSLNEEAALSASGGLYRLSFYAVLAEEAASLFRWEEAVRTEGPARLTSPLHLFVESASVLPRTEPLRDPLWRALTPSWEGAGAGTLRVRLDLHDPALAQLKRHAYRAELMHQVWSWRGRPPAPHPAFAGPPAPAVDPRAELRELLAFEMAEFGERSDDEHRRLPMRRLGCGDADRLDAAFLYLEDLAVQGPRGETRALHHRFAVRLWSRYEGLLPEAGSYLDSLDSASGTRWRRLFVPCRPMGGVPVPKIKLVLPLTQEAPEDCGRGPGLLVVTDGPWYEVGGLAEELGVEVVTVTAPDTSGDAYYQVGTDPILTDTSALATLSPSPTSQIPGGASVPAAGEPGSTAGALPAGEFTVDFPPLVGAIGHTRDRSATTPNFLASSFLVPPPELRRCKDGEQVPAEADLAWWFLKLRFYRRLLGPEGESESERSAPFWVQLLPPVERIEKDWFETGSGGRQPAVWLDEQRTLHLTGRLKAARPTFHLFAVMTRQVSDFAGRPDQEAYVGVWWPKDDTWLTDDATREEIARPEGSTQAPDLYVRWIEVQSPKTPKIDCGDELWSALFDATPASLPEGQSPDSTRARIVRISKRFPVTLGRPA
ncbi:MAG: hypothetical protein M3O15_12950, partial [Acidobacteriota bacterium]|nr:hypothetical protein [Acidobacteriota bacterium]